MNVMQLFPTLVFTRYCDIDLNELYQQILNFKNLTPSVVISNRGGYQGSNFTYEPLEHIIKESIPIKNNKPLNNLRIQSWVNINKTGDYNDIHDHDSYTGTFLSGVFYVKAPSNCGRIRLYDPRFFVTSAPDMKYYNDNNNYHYFVPEPNFLVLFPGWLKHDVEPNLSSEDRVSVAFNVFIN